MCAHRGPRLDSPCVLGLLGHGPPHKTRRPCACFAADRHDKATCVAQLSAPGTPQLDSSSLGRLQSSNRLFIQLADFLQCARDLQVPFSVEPPESSWLWHLPSFCPCSRTCPVCICFEKKKKRMQAARCRCGSWHLGVTFLIWQLPTGAVRSTPKPSVNPLRQAFLASLLSGFRPFPPLSSGFPRVPPGTAPVLHAVRAGPQLQPKSSKLPQVFQRLISAQLPPLDDERRLTMPWMGVPKYARLLRSSEVEKGGHQPTPGVCQRRSHQATPHFFSQVPNHQATPHFFSLFRCKGPTVSCKSPQSLAVDKSQSLDVQQMYELAFGVYRELVQFIYQALSLLHPFDAARSLPDSLARVLFNTSTVGPLGIMRS